MAFIFRGDFETGDASQWDGVFDETFTASPGLDGKSTILTSYTTGTGLTVLPNAGSTQVAFCRTQLRKDVAPISGQPGSTRAERIHDMHAHETFAAIANQTIYITWALMFDPDTNWHGNWAGGINNHQGQLKLGQMFGHGFAAYSGGPTISVTGYEGLPGLSVGWWGWGGIFAGGIPNEHRLSMDPAIGNGWTTFLSPTAAATSGAQRNPQILGPRCQQGQNIPIELGVWYEFIVRQDIRTNLATGMYQAWYRKKGSGATWTKTMESPAAYKTVTWSGSGDPNVSTGFDRNTFGGYGYDLPAEVSLFWDQFTWSTSFAEAESVFPTEGEAPSIPLLFTGDFEVGDSSQYDGLFDETTVTTVTGQGFVLSGYQTTFGPFLTPETGVVPTAMARSLLKTSGQVPPETRAERAKAYDYANYHNLSAFFSFSFLLDPDYSWTFDWSANAAVSDSGLVLLHILRRNLGGYATRLILHPPGWEGETEPVVTFTSRGGLWTGFSTAEHRVACDPTVGNGWVALVSPDFAESGNYQRYPQIIGPHCQQGQSLPLTIGEWWEVIMQVDCRTDEATGGYSVWVRKKDSGPLWTQTLNSSRVYKTVGWQPINQPPTTSGPNNQHRVGGLANGLISNRSFFWDQFTVKDSFEAAAFVFAEETFDIPRTTHPTGTRITGTRITGTRLTGVGIQ